MKKFFLVAISVVATYSSAYAQDVRFTQFYNAPIHLNPSFTGATGAARVGTNLRRQGNTNESSYRTFSAYGDYYIKDFSLSSGLMFLSDEDDYSGFTLKTIALPVSYNFSVNKNITIKPALQGSYTTQGLDFSRFLFSDQLDTDGNVSGGTSEPLAVDNMINYFDVAGGILAFGENWWFGYAMHNLLQNNVSFIGGESTLATRYSLHGGIAIDLAGPGRNARKTAKTIMPTFNYISQGGFSQLDAGVIGQYEPLVMGVLYRGIPNPLSEGEYSAASFIFGLSKFDLSLGYSFDLPLNNRINQGGIHEISITFLFDPSDPGATPRSAKRLKCPLPY
ncbi:MAG: type IX secretion system PorP/SprF family membrane protein [Marinoscillum sp.]|jgi:type IX secretion system PorP/SprF family membrane protein